MNPLDKLKILSINDFDANRIPNPLYDIAIVGNTKLSDEDRDSIDRSNCIVRFNNYATREELIGHGTTDRFSASVLFTTFDLHSINSSPGVVVAGIPWPFKQENVADKFKKWYPFAKARMVNPWWQSEMCNQLNIKSEGYKHPFPSIGFTCLWHLFRELQDISSVFRPKIYVCGFEWYYKDGLFQGYSMKKTDQPSHVNHYYPNELRWCLNKEVQEAYRFGPKQQEIFEIAKSQLNGN
jgi:hypothetical protein